MSATDLCAPSSLLTDPIMPSFDDGEDWEEYGLHLAQAEGNLNWAWGAWINAFPKTEGGYTEDEVMFRASRVTGRPDVTLRQLSYVDRKVPARSRQRDLPWSHHAEVAALTPAEQEHYLSRCVNDPGEGRNFASRETLRAWIRDDKALTAGGPDHTPSSRPDRVQDDPDEGETVYSELVPEEGEATAPPLPRFVDKNQEAIYLVGLAADKLRTVADWVDAGTVRLTPGAEQDLRRVWDLLLGDGWGLLSAIDRTEKSPRSTVIFRERHEVVGGTPSDKVVGGHIRTGQQPVSVGGLSDTIGETTLTLDQWKDAQ